MLIGNQIRKYKEIDIETCLEKKKTKGLHQILI